MKGTPEAKVAKGQWHPSSGGTLGGHFLPGDLSQALDGSVPAFLLIHWALLSQMLSTEKSVWDGNAFDQWKSPSRVYPCIWDLGHPPTLGTVERLNSETFLSCFLCFLLYLVWRVISSTRKRSLFYALTLGRGPKDEVTPQVHLQALHKKFGLSLKGRARGVHSLVVPMETKVRMPFYPLATRRSCDSEIQTSKEGVRESTG